MMNSKSLQNKKIEYLKILELKKEKEKELVDCKSSLKELEDKFTVLNEVKECLINSQQIIRNDLIIRMEEFVTLGLREIFGNNDLAFKVEFKVRWGKNEINFFIIEKNKKVNVVLGEAGGMKDMVGILLKIFFILYNSNKNFPIILDEVGKHLSREYQENFSLFLRNFSEKFRRQVILITHQLEVINNSTNKITL